MTPTLLSTCPASTFQGWLPSPVGKESSHPPGWPVSSLTMTGLSGPQGPVTARQVTAVTGTSSHGQDSRGCRQKPHGKDPAERTTRNTLAARRLGKGEILSGSRILPFQPALASPQYDWGHWLQTVPLSAHLYTSGQRAIVKIKTSSTDRAGYWWSSDGPSSRESQLWAS